MENFTNIVEEQPSSSKIDEKTFREYLSKLFIWNFEKRYLKKVFSSFQWKKRVH